MNTLYRLLGDNSAEKSISHLERFIVNKRCSRCHGERILEEGRQVRIGAVRYPEATKMNITGLKNWCHEYDSIIGVKNINDVYYVSQKAIGRNSRSNPGTYTGVFDLIRDLYANLSEAKKNGLTKEHFSFNSVKGQCEECKGAGEITIPMHFMPDIFATCTKCNGKRYREDVLAVQYKGYSVSDLLELEISEVKELFKEEAKIFEILDMLDKVGLSYIKLGQSATTLSGGEAQRIKLAKELCDNMTKDVIYILDEPTLVFTKRMWKSWFIFSTNCH